MLTNLAGVSTGWRGIVRDALFQRVNDAVTPFVKRCDVVPFFDLLYALDAVILGGPAQEVTCVGSSSVQELRGRGGCLTQRDMNILVPDSAGLEVVVRWLARRGYVHWRALNASNGCLGPKTKFAAGVKDPKEVVAPRVGAWYPSNFSIS